MSKHGTHRPPVLQRHFTNCALVLCTLALATLIGISGCGNPEATSATGEKDDAPATAGGDVRDLSLADVPPYTGDPYVIVNGNVPIFPEEDIEPRPFEEYSPLDDLGRCGPAYACLGPETMPTEPRGDISGIHPSGWRQRSYDFIDGETVYTRSHLIAHALAGEDANSRNLITGTRYMNAEVMTGFEMAVGDYIEATGNHVLYRAAPLFDGSELVARGVHIEALSVEDGGQGIGFNVFLYNVQPGVEIDYATGENWANPHVPGPDGAVVEAAGSGVAANRAAGGGETLSASPASIDYVLNTNTRKFHLPGCASVADIGAANRQDYAGDRQALIELGYSPCGSCRP